MLSETKRTRLLKVAQTHWGGFDEPKFSRKVLSDVLNYVVESNYSIEVLRLLDKTRFLEQYLFPFYEEKSPEYHVELIALMVSIKDAYGEPWEEIVEDYNFESFVDRVLRIVVKTFDEHSGHLLEFLRACLSQIGRAEVRTKIGPLVSIPIWTCLPEETVSKILQDNGHLKKPWKGSQKKFKGADEATQAKMEFDRAWLASLVVNLGATLAKQAVDDRYLYSFVRFIVSLVGKVPTRRYTNTLLKDHNLVSILHSYKVDRDLVSLLEGYMYMPYNDYMGEPLTDDEAWKAHVKKVEELQTIAFRDYRSELQLLALATPESVEKDIAEHLSGLTDDQLRELADKLHIRHKYGKKKVVGKKSWRSFLVNCFAQVYKRPAKVKPSLAKSLPTELDLYSKQVSRLVAEKDGALPDLSSQYLSVADLAARVVQLERCELLAYMRQELELIVKRMRPELVPGTTANNSSAGSKRKRDGEAVEAKKVKFTGYSKMASRMRNNNPPSVLVETPPVLTATGPGYVRIELDLDLDSKALAYWSDLKVGQYVCVVHAEPEPTPIKTLRMAKVHKIIMQGDKQRKDEGHLERLIVDVDPTQFEFGKENDETTRLEAMNLVVKLRPEILTLISTIRALEDLEVPHGLSSLVDSVLLGIHPPEEDSTEPLPPRTQEKDSTEPPPPETQEDTVYNGLHEEEVAAVEKALSKKFSAANLVLRPRAEVLPAVALLRRIHAGAQEDGGKRILVISGSDRLLRQVFSELDRDDRVLPTHLLHFTPDEPVGSSSQPGTIAYFMQLRTKLLGQVENIADQISVAGAFGDSCATGIYFLAQYREQILSLRSEQLGEGALHRLNVMFTALKPLELPTSSGFESMRRNYLMHNPAQIVGMTGEAYAQAPPSMKAGFSTIVFLAANALSEAHTLLPLVGNHSSVTRIAMFGNSNALKPWVRNDKLRRACHLGTSLFGRLAGRMVGKGSNEWSGTNPGFEHSVQFVKTRDHARSGKHARNNGDESEPSPQFVQNVGEAEYAVALFQYMRLLEYPAESISVVTTTSGQKELIKSLFRGLAASSAFAFGEPTVCTVRESAPADYVILSLVRTSGLGFDDASEARYASAQGVKGVYVLGDWDLYRCYEPFSAMSLTAGDLVIVINELYGKEIDYCERQAVKMQGLRHLAQYVQEMTDQRISYESTQA
ncbi:hypothetical protein TRVA0_045S01310 [Trichomonascus vanleenenianus]|uniref:uncharacterized protein n=1 Tax=Trichomonascus vanleenenianus TaxID=2268995 RepID=UPI003ECA3F81